MLSTSSNAAAGSVFENGVAALNQPGFQGFSGITFDLMAIPPKHSKHMADRRNDGAWKTSTVDPLALFIWETPDKRIAIGRALARTIIVLVTGGSAASTAHYWIPVLCKWLGAR